MANLRNVAVGTKLYANKRMGGYSVVTVESVNKKYIVATGDKKIGLDGVALPRENHFNTYYYLLTPEKELEINRARKEFRLVNTLEMTSVLLRKSDVSKINDDDLNSLLEHVDKLKTNIKAYLGIKDENE
jgi:hypothetical protein